MSENLPNMDDLFRKAIDAHEEIPSGNVWANIDKNLDKKKVVSISKKYQKLKWAAAALLIFSAGMAMYTWSTRIRNKELVKQNEVNKRLAGTTAGKTGAYAGTDTAGRIFNDKTTASTANRTGQKSPDSTGTVTGKVGVAVKGRSQVLSTQPRVAKTSLENKQAGLNNGSAKVDNMAMKENATVARQKGLRQNPTTGPTAAILTKVDADIVNSSATAGNKTVELADLPAFERAKRTIEVGTAPRQTSDLSFLEPRPIASATTILLTGSSKEPNSPAGKVAFKKSSVKPHFGSKISATVFYSADVVSTRVDNDRHTFREDDRNEIKNKERVSNTSGKGLLIHYNMDNHWGLQSGLTFSSLTTEIAPKTIFARPDARGNVNYRFNCLAGYSYVTLKSATGPAAGDSITALSSKNVLHYLGVPFAVTYKFFKGRFTLQPGVGVTANFLTSGTLETSLAGQSGNENKNIDHIEGLNTSYMNGSLSLAANYNFTKNFALSLTPVSRFALGAINKDAPVKTYISSFGLAAGLNISF